MESKQEKIKQDYLNLFDVGQYIDFRRQLFADKNWVDNHDFLFSSLFEFFNSEKFTGDRLLDLASGPTIHNMGAASLYFSNIILSDFLESNLEELRKWLKKDPNSQDWSVYIRMVAKVEKCTDIEDACKEIEERIRSSVKDVIHCDLLSDEVIAKEYRQPPFDVIVSSLTLENVAADWNSYSKCLGRINSLLKKGGKLVMIGLTVGNGYACRGQSFHFLQIKQEEIHKALEVNGFGDIKWKTKKQARDIVPNCETVYFVSSTKF